MTEQNRITVYPNDIELRFIKKEAAKLYRNNVSGYIMHLVALRMGKEKEYGK